MDGPRRTVVEMDAHEEDTRVRIGNRGAVIERDEDIGAPGHDGLEPGRLELWPEAKGDIEGEIFLLEMIAGNAAVLPAVAGIDHDGAEGAAGIDKPAGAAAEEKDAEREQEPDGFGIGHDKNGGL